MDIKYLTDNKPDIVEKIKSLQCENCEHYKEVQCVGMHRFENTKIFNRVAGGYSQIGVKMDEWAFSCTNFSYFPQYAKIGLKNRSGIKEMFKVLSGIPHGMNTVCNAKDSIDVGIMFIPNYKVFEKEFGFNQFNAPVMKYYDEVANITFVRVAMLLSGKFSVIVFNGNVCDDIKYMCYWASNKDVEGWGKGINYI